MTRKKGDVDLNINGKDKTTQAFKSVQKKLQNTASAVAILDGPLSAVSGRINALGAAFGRFNPTMVISASLFGGFLWALKSGTEEAIEFERHTFRMEAQLRATGNAAGFTSDKLTELAENLDATTLANDENARNAISQLLAFKRVSGDVFESAIILSQDYAEVFGRSLERSTRNIARALDSVEGLQTINRELSLLTKTEEEHAKSLFESGELIEYQTLIIGKLNAVLGGAGAGAAGGAAGAADSAALAWRLLKRDMADGLGVVGAWEGAADRLTNLLINLRKLVGSDVDKKPELVRVDHVANLAAQTENLAKQQKILQKAIDTELSQEVINQLITNVAVTQNAIAVKQQWIDAHEDEADALRRGVTLAQILAEKKLQAIVAEKEFVELRDEANKLYEKNLSSRDELNNKFADSFDRVIEFISMSHKRGEDVDSKHYETLSALQSKYLEDKVKLDQLDVVGPQKPAGFDEKQAAAIAGLEQSLLDENQKRESALAEWFVKRNELVSKNVADTEKAEQLRLDIAKKYLAEHIKLVKIEEDKKSQLRWKASSDVASIATNLSSIFADQSKTAFKTHQAFAATEAGISTAQGVAKAWGQGGVFGYIGAAAVFAAGTAQIHNILKASPGDGGGSASPPADVGSSVGDLLGAPDNFLQSQAPTTNIIRIEIGGKSLAEVVVEGNRIAQDNDMQTFQNENTFERVVIA